MNRQKINKMIINSLLSISLALGASFLNSNQVLADTTNPITINRISGQDRFETSVKLSQYWKQASDYAVLVNSNDYPDAVGVSPLARKFEAPILLTNKDSIPDVVKTELKRLKVRKVFIIGGTGVISTNVENELRKLGIAIEERIAGKDRFETSAKIAHHLVSLRNDVYVVENENWQNALAIAPVASYRNSPVILVDPKAGVADTIKQNICNEGHTYFIVGEKYHEAFRNQAEKGLGEGKANGIYVNVLGNTREDTNLEIFNTFKDTGNIETDGALKLDRVYIVSNEGLADALSLSTIAGQDRSLILFINKDYYSTAKKFLNENASKIKDIEVVGGTGILPQSVIDDLYKGMTASKTTQDNEARVQYAKDWSKRNVVSFHVTQDLIDNSPALKQAQEERKAWKEATITLEQAIKILNQYLGVDYSKEGYMDGLVHDYDNVYIIEDGTSLLGHRCMVVDTPGVSLDYGYIFDRDTGNLYEKVDKSNKKSYVYKFVKNLLGK